MHVHMYGLTHEHTHPYMHNNDKLSYHIMNELETILLSERSYSQNTTSYIINSTYLKHAQEINGLRYKVNEWLLGLS